MEDGMLSMSGLDTNTNVSTFTLDTTMSMKDQMTCAIAATQLRRIPITRHFSLDPGILRCPTCTYFTAERKQFLIHMAYEGCPSQYNQIDYIAVMVQLVNHSASDEVSPSSSEDEAEGGARDSARRRKKPERKKDAHVEMKKCGFCDLLMVKGTQEYYAHLRTHLPEGFVCIKCSFVAQHNHHLLFHWFSAHETYRPFKCSYRDRERNSNCKYRCISKSMLASHEKVHLHFYQYHCTCEYKTRHKSSLKKHLESTGHLPHAVLNRDGSLNPDIIIDVNSRKRGPRQRKDANTPGRKMSNDSNPLSDCPNKSTIGFHQLGDTNSPRASQCGTPEAAPAALFTDNHLSTHNLMELCNKYAQFMRTNELFYKLFYNIPINEHFSESMNDLGRNSLDNGDAAERRSTTSSRSPDEVVVRNNVRNATITGHSLDSAREIFADNRDSEADRLNVGHVVGEHSVALKSSGETPDDKCVDDTKRQVDFIDFNTYTNTNGADEPFNLSLPKTMWNKTQLQTRPVVTSLLTSVKTRSKDVRKRTESEELEDLNKSAKCKRRYGTEIPLFPATGAFEDKSQEDRAAGTENVAGISEHLELGSRNVADDGSASVPENARSNSKHSHSDPCTYMCGFCELTFRNLVMFDEHMGYHDKTNPLRCRKCHEEYRDFVYFFKHIGSKPH